jgi:hypothetical protein
MFSTACFSQTGDFSLNGEVNSFNPAAKAFLIFTVNDKTVIDSNFIDKVYSGLKAT